MLEAQALTTHIVIVFQSKLAQAIVVSFTADADVIWGNGEIGDGDREMEMEMLMVIDRWRWGWRWRLTDGDGDGDGD